jgi:hypothetical protein
MIEIDNCVFKTKKELLAYVKDIIEENGIGLLKKDSKHFNFINELIKNHSEYDFKKGKGIDYFEIKQNKINKKALELYIIRVDRTSIDISYRHCCTQNKSDNLSRAMRYSIRKQILKFRNQIKNENIIKCCYCGKENTDFEVDHVEPFITLTKKFLQNKIKIPKDFIDDEKTNMPKFKEDDYEFKKEWKKYHKKNAKLQILCMTCNRHKSQK